MHHTRRSVLATGVGLLATGGLAGCTGSIPAGVDGESGGIESGYAAFFALWDWSRGVGGSAVEFDNAVSVGSMGHGYEPPGDLVRDIAATDAFIYLDSPEFSWAQDIASTLSTDYEHIAVIDVMAGMEVDLLDWEGHDHDDNDDHDAHDDHDNATNNGTDHESDHDHGHDDGDWDHQSGIGHVAILDGPDGGELADAHDDHWHGELPEIPVGHERTFGVRVLDADGDAVALGHDEGLIVDARVAATDRADSSISIESAGDHIDVEGESTGEAGMRIELHHDGAVVWESPPIDLTVVEDADGAHTPANVDPHVWVDPVYAKRGVETIADELSALDPEREETYRSNAADYIDELDEIDAAFEQLVADAERTTAVLAGHDSFRYLEHRYGFELHSPVGVAPDAQADQSRIRDTIELVDDRGIDVILYDYFESPNLAESIVQHSDATDTAALTPLEGTTPEWSDAGWGYVEQMTEINLPALRRALGAD